MNVFVTGATGTLGKPVVRHLIAAGHKVYALSHSQANTSTVRQLGAQPISANLFDRASLIDALQTAHADAVIHLATRIPPTSRMGKVASWQENDRVRRDGTRLLVDAALATGVQTFVYPSFYYVYPDRGEQWIDALSTPVQEHVIQQATIDAEAEVARFTRAQRCGVVLRLGNLYGPEVPSALEQLGMAHKGFAILPGPKDAYLSYTWAEDAARALVMALTEALAGVYDVVDDEPLTREAFARALAQSVGRRRLFQLPNGILKLLTGAAADMVNRSQRVSNRRFKEATGWKPTVASAREGWQLIEHAQQQPERSAVHA